MPAPPCPGRTRWSLSTAQPGPIPSTIEIKHCFPSSSHLSCDCEAPQVGEGPPQPPAVVGVADLYIYLQEGERCGGLHYGAGSHQPWLLPGGDKLKPLPLLQPVGVRGNISLCLSPAFFQQAQRAQAAPEQTHSLGLGGGSATAKAKAGGPLASSPSPPAVGKAGCYKSQGMPTLRQHRGGSRDAGREDGDRDKVREQEQHPLPQSQQVPRSPRTGRGAGGRGRSGGAVPVCWW